MATRLCTSLGLAALQWQTSEGWTGKRFHLGTNKEVFDAEVYAIYQALRIFEERGQSGKKYMIFSDCQPAIRRALSDVLGPGQQWARAIIEVATRLVSRGNGPLSCGSQHMREWEVTRLRMAWRRRRRRDLSTGFRTRSSSRLASPTYPEEPRSVDRSPPLSGLRIMSGQRGDTSLPGVPASGREHCGGCESLSPCATTSLCQATRRLELSCMKECQSPRGWRRATAGGAAVVRDSRGTICSRI